MKKNDTAQMAIWYCEEDDHRKIEWWRKQGCQEQLDASAEHYGVKMSPIRWYELEPGENDAGFPPEDCQGTNYKLLVAEADVIGNAVKTRPTTFVQNLDFKDLEVLRKATRETYAKATGHPVTLLSDNACDELIDELGPDVTEKLLYEALNATKH